MMDYAHTLTIPLQPLTTVTSTHHSQALEIPLSIWRAIDIWYCVTDDAVAARVGAVIQARLDELSKRP